MSSVGGFTLYPSPLQTGFRFLPHPFPAASSAFFTVRLPVRERHRGYFVHLFDRSGVRSCLSAGGAPSATEDVAAPVPDHIPFGPSLTASLACFFLRLLSALPLIYPLPDCWPPTAVMLAVAVSARAFTADLRSRLRCPPGFRP